MIVAEAPGQEEINHTVCGPIWGNDSIKIPMAIPLCGPAGRLAHQMLNYLDIEEGDYILSNATKTARFKEDGTVKTPTQSEVEADRSDLVLEIVKIQPKLLIAFGKIALWSLCYSGKIPMHDLKITKQCGKLHRFNYRISGFPYVDIPVLPILHPSAALRDKNDDRGYRTIIRESLQDNKQMILEHVQHQPCSK